MITEDYCSFEVAKLLKEKGFDEPCECAYSSGGQYLLSCYKGIADRRIKNDEASDFSYSSTAPTHQMAMKWLRDEKRISIIIEFDLTKRGYCPYVYQLDYDMDWTVKWRVNTPMKYEEAVEAALKYTLENLI